MCTPDECSCITAVGKCADFKTAECGSGYTIKSPLPETECKSGQCTITECCDASSGCNTAPTCTSNACACEAGHYYDKNKCNACPQGQYNNKAGRLAMSVDEIKNFFDERIVLTEPATEDALSVDVHAAKTDKVKQAGILLQTQCELLSAVERKVCEAYEFHDVGSTSKLCETITECEELLLTSKLSDPNPPALFYAALDAKRTALKDAATDLQKWWKCKICPEGTYAAKVATQDATQDATQESANLDASAAKLSKAEVDPSRQVNGIITGATGCQGCLFAKYSVGIAPSCEPCQAGLYLPNGAAKDKCLTCPGGQSSFAESQTCYACPAGYEDKKDAKGVEDKDTPCGECPAGWFSKYGKMFANWLPTNGKWVKQCSHCPSGYHQDKAQQSLCLPCFPGQYNDDSKQTECKNCVAGKYTNTSQLKECYFCPIGYQQPDTSQTVCLGCSPGKFSDQTSATSCKECVVGRYQIESGQDGCHDCPSGRTTTAAGTPRCDLCSPGKHGDPDGDNEDVNGEIPCLECLVGMFADSSNKEVCKDCPIGFYQNEIGKSMCFPCIPGKYNDDLKQETCKDCDKGQFTSTSNQQSCKSCGVGESTPEPGSTRCEKCPVGEAGTPCEECATGQYRGSTDSAVACLACPAGFDQQATSQASCIPCFPGTFRLDAEKCEHCPAGFYTNATKQSHCVRCRVGESANEGSVRCEECPPGQAGEPCTRCIEGKYRGGDDNPEACLNCPSGFYSNEQGQPFCLLCDVGKFGSSAGGASCQLCATGQFQDQKQGVACKDCDKGRYVNSEQSVRCLDCDAGKYTDITGSTACKGCGRGSYQNEKGQSNPKCKKCESSNEIPNKETEATGCVVRQLDIEKEERATVVDVKVSSPWRNGTLLRIEWTARKRSVESLIDGVHDETTHFNVSISTTKRFDGWKDGSNPGTVTHQVDKSQQFLVLDVMDSSFPTSDNDMNSPMSLVDLTRYVRVNQFNQDLSKGGEWSPVSEAWVDSNDCLDQWIDASSSKPEDWRCCPCPTGAACNRVRKTTSWLGKDIGAFRRTTLTTPSC